MDPIHIPVRTTARVVSAITPVIVSLGFAANAHLALSAGFAARSRAVAYTNAHVAQAPAQATPPAVRLWLPLAQRAGAPLPAKTAPPTAVPSLTRTATPSPTSTQPPTSTPTVTPTPQAGLPNCPQTSGDAGGFRFSLDGGASLAPNAKRLGPGLAYTWDLQVDPRNPDHILELHQNRLFRSADAGCTFSPLAALPKGTWWRLRLSRSAPTVWVLADYQTANLAYSTDGGATWSLDTAPDIIQELSLDPNDAWHWWTVGQNNVLYERKALGERWEAHPITVPERNLVNAAAQAPARTNRWWVATSTGGLVQTDNGGASWQPVGSEMFADVGAPPERTVAVVGVSVTAAPSDADTAYAVVNRVGLNQTERGIWRTRDGGLSWTRVVTDSDLRIAESAQLTGGTQVFVSPHDPLKAFFAFGQFFQGYGTDLFRSQDGLAHLAVSHFNDFYEILAMAFGPAGSDAVFVGATNDSATAGR